jgi:uncharacterized protein (DUF2344 family)
MKKTIDIDKLKKEISRFEISVAKPIASGKLKDGRKFQVQVTITTDEDEFIEGDEYVNLNS